MSDRFPCQTDSVKGPLRNPLREGLSEEDFFDDLSGERLEPDEVKRARSEEKIM